MLRLLALLLLLLGPGPAHAESYTMLDGALAEARQAAPEAGGLLVGLAGSAMLEDWQRLSSPEEAAHLRPVIAADGPALQRILLAQGVDCGLLVAPLGRRGFQTQPFCAVPMDVVVIFSDGQRLYGHARPAPGSGTLALTLPQTDLPLTIPLSLIRHLEAPSSPPVAGGR